MCPEGTSDTSTHMHAHPTIRAVYHDDDRLLLRLGEITIPDPAAPSPPAAGPSRAHALASHAARMLSSVSNGESSGVVDALKTGVLSAFSAFAATRRLSSFPITSSVSSGVIT